VTFTNRGATQHNAAGADNGGWDTGLLNTGQTATVTFNKPGKYLYSCTPHPSMMGQIVVVGPEIAGAPPVVVESPGVKADGPMTMPGHGAH
jgi:hypothetical protein